MIGKILMVIFAIFGSLFFIPYFTADNTDAKALATVVAIPGIIIIGLDLLIFLATKFL